MKEPVSMSDRTAARVFRRYFPLLLILWILFVLYPNVANLVISLYRAAEFKPDPSAVESFLDGLPSDPAEIEQAVRAIVPYRYDWEVYGMPWYCPTVAQVVEKRQGDCKARALVLASILEAKNITYQVRYSPIHTWVHYESKQETSLENTQVQWYQYDPDTGERRFQIPHIPFREVADAFWKSFWQPMPDDRRALLIGGPVVLIAARVALRKRKPPEQRRTGQEVPPQGEVTDSTGASAH